MKTVINHSKFSTGLKQSVATSAIALWPTVATFIGGCYNAIIDRPEQTSGFLEGADYR